MRTLLFLILLTAVIACDGRRSAANAEDCISLWVEQNSIYKQHGYCFKSERAIGYFGNAGCTVSDLYALELSLQERARIANITMIERSLGCNERAP